MNIKSKGKSRKMLEYSKKVLKKVSFDIKLFKKELSKAYENLLEEEIEELRQWVIKNFGPQYCLQPIVIEN
jgi:hypothetical protein